MSVFNQRNIDSNPFTLFFQPHHEPSWPSSLLYDENIPHNDATGVNHKQSMADYDEDDRLIHETFSSTISSSSPPSVSKEDNYSYFYSKNAIHNMYGLLHNHSSNLDGTTTATTTTITTTSRSIEDTITHSIQSNNSADTDLELSKVGLFCSLFSPTPTVTKRQEHIKHNEEQEEGKEFHDSQRSEEGMTKHDIDKTRIHDCIVNQGEEEIDPYRTVDRNEPSGCMSFEQGTEILLQQRTTNVLHDIVASNPQSSMIQFNVINSSYNTTQEIMASRVDVSMVHFQGIYTTIPTIPDTMFTNMTRTVSSSCDIHDMDSPCNEERNHNIPSMDFILPYNPSCGFSASIIDVDSTSTVKSSSEDSEIIIILNGDDESQQDFNPPIWNQCPLDKVVSNHTRQGTRFSHSLDCKEDEMPISTWPSDEGNTSNIVLHIISNILESNNVKGEMKDVLVSQPPSAPEIIHMDTNVPMHSSSQERDSSSSSKWDNSTLSSHDEIQLQTMDTPYFLVEQTYCKQKILNQIINDSEPVHMNGSQGDYHDVETSILRDMSKPHGHGMKSNIDDTMDIPKTNEENSAGINIGRMESVEENNQNKDISLNQIELHDTSIICDGNTETEPRATGEQTAVVETVNMESAANCHRDETSLNNSDLQNIPVTEEHITIGVDNVNMKSDEHYRDEETTMNNDNLDTKLPRKSAIKRLHSTSQTIPVKDGMKRRTTESSYTAEKVLDFSSHGKNHKMAHVQKVSSKLATGDSSSSSTSSTSLQNSASMASLKDREDSVSCTGDGGAESPKTRPSMKTMFRPSTPNTISYSKKGSSPRLSSRAQMAEMKHVKNLNISAKTDTCDSFSKSSTSNKSTHSSKNTSSEILLSRPTSNQRRRLSTKVTTEKTLNAGPNIGIMESAEKNHGEETKLNTSELKDICIITNDVAETETRVTVEQTADVENGNMESATKYHDDDTSLNNSDLSNNFKLCYDEAETETKVSEDHITIGVDNVNMKSDEHHHDKQTTMNNDNLDTILPSESSIKLLDSASQTILVKDVMKRHTTDHSIGEKLSKTAKKMQDFSPSGKNHNMAHIQKVSSKLATGDSSSSSTSSTSLQNSTGMASLKDREDSVSCTGDGGTESPKPRPTMCRPSTPNTIGTRSTGYSEKSSTPRLSSRAQAAEMKHTKKLNISAKTDTCDSFSKSFTSNKSTGSSKNKLSEILSSMPTSNQRRRLSTKVVTTDKVLIINKGSSFKNLQPMSKMRQNNTQPRKDLSKDTSNDNSDKAKSKTSSENTDSTKSKNPTIYSSAHTNAQRDVRRNISSLSTSSLRVKRTPKCKVLSPGGDSVASELKYLEEKGEQNVGSVESACLLMNTVDDLPSDSPEAMDTGPPAIKDSSYVTYSDLQASFIESESAMNIETLADPLVFRADDGVRTFELSHNSDPKLQSQDHEAWQLISSCQTEKESATLSLSSEGILSTVDCRHTDSVDERSSIHSVDGVYNEKEEDSSKHSDPTLPFSSLVYVIDDATDNSPSFTLKSTAIESVVCQENLNHSHMSSKISASVINSQDKDSSDIMNGYHDEKIEFPAKSVCDQRQPQSESIQSSLCSDRSSFCNADFSSPNIVYPSDALSAARNRRSSLLQNFQKLLHRAKAKCLANVKVDVVKSYGSLDSVPEVTMTELEATATPYDAKVDIESHFEIDGTSHKCNQESVPQKAVTELEATIPRDERFDQVEVKEAVSAEPNSYQDPPVTIIFLEENATESQENDANIDEVSIEDLQKIITQEDGEFYMINTLDDVSRVVSVLGKMVRDQGSSHPSQMQKFLTSTKNELDFSFAEYNAINIQRIFRGYVARRLLLVHVGVAKRKKWEDKTKSISITMLHSKWRRVARAELRSRASSPIYCKGGGSMIVAIRRVCAIIIQRRWRWVTWRRRVNKKYLLKSYTRENGDKRICYNPSIRLKQRGKDILNHRTISDSHSRPDVLPSSCHYLHDERYHGRASGNHENQRYEIHTVSQKPTKLRLVFDASQKRERNIGVDVFDDRLDVEEIRYDSSDDRRGSAFSPGLYSPAEF